MPWSLLGNGCDKKFFVEQSGNGGYGAICCSDQVAAREMKAYIELKKLGISLIPTVLPWTDLAGFSVDGVDYSPKYQIERLYIGRTFKPLMCAMAMMLPVKKELAKGNKDKLLNGFHEIRSNLEGICNIVGELTLAVNGVVSGDGGLYMLDFSPGESGGRAITNIESIRKGIDNLIKEVEGM